jgi:hypothetical protein
MQKHASLLPGLRRSIVAVAIVSAFSAPHAGAVPIAMTSGSIHMDSTTPVPFDDVFVNLVGAAFTLTNEFLIDSFLFAGTPNPAFILLPPGTAVEFTGHASLFAPGDLLVYSGDAYRASGVINVSTSSIVVGPLLTLPFTLSGSIHGEKLGGPGTVDLDIIGGGTVTAMFEQVSLPDAPDWEFRSITYEIAPVPEPASWMLLGAGLLGVVARRRSTRRVS